MSDILLDPQIRDNALIPIFVVFLASNFIRQNLIGLTKDEPKIDMMELKKNNTLARARMLKMPSARFLGDLAYRNRKAYYCKEEKGVLNNPPAAPADQMAQQDPGAAMGMMKEQMIFLVGQGLIGYWVSFLYNGFLVGKTPFPLTFRFKSMLQRGVEVDNLEPGYISGLCWYFIIMMAIGHIQMFIMSLFEENNQNIDPNGAGDPMMMMMGVNRQQMANPMMGAPDNKKVFQQEKEALQIHYFESCMETIETELWKKWKRGGARA